MMKKHVERPDQVITSRILSAVRPSIAQTGRRIGTPLTVYVRCPDSNLGRWSSLFLSAASLTKEIPTLIQRMTIV